MKALLINWLLSRDGGVSDWVGKVIRNGMVIAGAWLASQGYATEDQVVALTAGAVAVGGVVWSFARALIGKAIG